jgi:uncharacterized protein (DUF2252 family)
MPTRRTPQYLSVEERRAQGKRAREHAPRSSIGAWRPATDRPDPIATLTAQDDTREPDLVPIRHGRMMVSPFTFYRGGARIMAWDLSSVATSGLKVQLCGDAHLSNFGVFASPERQLVFDINDFDETLPGPFEWDVARLAASFVIASRNNRFTEEEARVSAVAAATAYRESMAGFAQMRTLEIWYAHLSAEEILASVRTPRLKESIQRGLDHSRTRDSLQALTKLAEMVDGHYRIVSRPPVVMPIRDLAHLSDGEIQAGIHEMLHEYRRSLPDERRHLLERYHFTDAAHKIVGVGSVGLRAFIALLQGRDEDDPLFLQMKEARHSVMEEHLPKSRFRNHGQRVVEGQRLMQAASDIFLGWTKGIDQQRNYYWRQLRDMKGSLDVEHASPAVMTLYARTCGWTLARAHARSGDPVAIAAYLGVSDRFDRAMGDFAERYADVNDGDHDEFCRAIAAGKLPVREGV